MVFRKLSLRVQPDLGAHAGKIKHSTSFLVTAFNSFNFHVVYGQSWSERLVRAGALLDFRNALHLDGRSGDMFPEISAKTGKKQIPGRRPTNELVLRRLGQELSRLRISFQNGRHPFRKFFHEIRRTSMFGHARI